MGALPAKVLSQVQQMALSSWAELRLVPVRLEEPPMTAARQQRAELAMLDGVAPPVAQPTYRVRGRPG